MRMCVNHRGRARSGLAAPDAQASAYVGSREPAAGLRQQQGALLCNVEGRAAAVEVALERPAGMLADRYEPRLRALPLHAHDLAIEVDRVDVERDQLLRAQTGRVCELEQRAVAELER